MCYDKKYYMQHTEFDSLIDQTVMCEFLYVDGE